MPRLPAYASLLITLLAAAGPAALRAGEDGAGAYAAVERHDLRIYQEVAPAVVGITCRLSPTQGYFGTGVVISADGYILTSTTVVPKGAGNIKVFFAGAMEKTAEVAGLDEGTESTLLKVDAEGLKYVPLADSAAAKPGEMAYTFGNPFGTLSSDDKVSFSRGFVSGVYKLTENGDWQSKYRDLIVETEAAVNPGSDGGPLIDGQGRLLGIISLGYSERRWLGCVVPVHLIAPKFEATRSMKPPERHLVPPEPVLRREETWQRAIAGAAPAVVQVIVPRSEKVPPRPERPTYVQQRAEASKRYRMRPAGPVSGVVVSADGRVLTAHYHLTGKVHKDQLKVRLPDGRELPAKMLGFDQNLDVALLQVETGGTPLTHAPLSEGVDLEIGDSLAVIGRSESLQTVTVNRGLVSAKSRGLRGTVQSSAFVNYGNAGGAVVDIRGRLVGITGQLSPKATWGQNSGIGFVATSASIRGILDDLAAGKEVKPPPRTFLGVAPGRDKATVLGATVGRVLPNSAAKDAGLRRGDVVTHIDGQPVESWSGLVRNIIGHKPGDGIKLTVQRGDQTLQLEAVLKARQ
jgi:S1-C subfamily serine protease